MSTSGRARSDPPWLPAWYLWGFLMVVVCGCAGGMTAQVRFDRAVHKYNDALRWKRASVVASFLSDKAATQYLEKHSAFGADYRLLDYEVQSMRPVDQGKKAVSVVQYSWLRLPANVVEKTVLEQQWTEHEGRWKIFKQEVIIGGKRLQVPRDMPF
jgi:hypothetical protein